VSAGGRKVRAWAKAFGDLDGALSAISGSLAEETVNLIKDGFRHETDPYGDRWTPKQAADGRKTLSGPTSRLKTGWHVRVQGASGFIVSPSVEYAAPHQNPKPGPGGKLKRPRRMMVPTAEKGLPPTWSRAYAEIVNEHLGALGVPESARAIAVRRIKLTVGGGS